MKEGIKKKDQNNGLQKKNTKLKQKDLSTFLHIDVLEADSRILVALMTKTLQESLCAKPGDLWLDVWIVFLGFCFADGKTVLSEVKTRLQSLRVKL